MDGIACFPQKELDAMFEKAVHLTARDNGAVLSSQKQRQRIVDNPQTIFRYGSYGARRGRKAIEPHVKQAIVEVVLQGATQAAAAHRYNVSLATVGNIMREHKNSGLT